MNFSTISLALNWNPCIRGRTPFGLLVKSLGEHPSTREMLTRVKAVAAATAAYIALQPLGWTSLMIGLIWIPEYLDIGFTAAEDPTALLIAVVISFVPVLAGVFVLRRWGSKRLGLMLAVLSVANILSGIGLLYSTRLCFPC